MHTRADTLPRCTEERNLAGAAVAPWAGQASPTKIPSFAQLLKRPETLKCLSFLLQQLLILPITSTYTQVLNMLHFLIPLFAVTETLGILLGET